MTAPPSAGFHSPECGPEASPRTSTCCFQSRLSTRLGSMGRRINEAPTGTKTASGFGERNEKPNSSVAADGLPIIRKSVTSMAGTRGNLRPSRTADRLRINDDPFARNGIGILEALPPALSKRLTDRVPRQDSWCCFCSSYQRWTRPGLVGRGRRRHNGLKASTAATDGRLR